MLSSNSELALCETLIGAYNAMNAHYEAMEDGKAKNDLYNILVKQHVLINNIIDTFREAEQNKESKYGKLRLVVDNNEAS